MDETQTIIQEQISTLPENVSGLLFSLDLRPHIHTIAQLRNLEEGQTTRLENEVVMVLIGLSDPQELAQHLSSGEGALDLGRAQVVSNDIHREVFSSVETTLQEMYPPEEIDGEPADITEQNIPTFSEHVRNTEQQPAKPTNETPKPHTIPESNTPEAIPTNRAVDELNVPPQITTAPKTPPTARPQTPNDPYRELIE